MIHQFSVSPDFPPERIPGWYIFNTWLQRQLDQAFHLELHDQFSSLRRAIRENRLDLVYANPFDAALLVREKGFRALVRPADRFDETIVLNAATHPLEHIEALPPGTRIAATDVPDVEMMGMILIEPADLGPGNTELLRCDSTIAVAKTLIRGEADIGFVLADAFDQFSTPVKKQLRPLIRSEIQVVHHSLMASPRLLEACPDLARLLEAMPTTEQGRGVLEALNFEAWTSLGDEDTEFMIDLMDTLLIRENH